MFSNKIEREGGTKQCNKQLEYVARMGGMKKSANQKGRDHRTTDRYRDNVKMNPKVMGCEDWASIRIAMKFKFCYVQEIPLVERIFASLHTAGSLVKSYQFLTTRRSTPNFMEPECSLPRS
jgi:hypothetical protein